MRAKLKRLAKITFPMVCFCALCACQTQRPSATLSATPEPPLAFPVVPVPPPPPDESAALMARYGESLRSWNPIKIYRDVGNLVVVQMIAFGIESGKYIMPMVSSHLPETGGDGGFKITPQPGSKEWTIIHFDSGVLSEDIGAAIVWDYHKKLQTAR